MKKSELKQLIKEVIREGNPETFRVTRAEQEIYNLNGDSAITFSKKYQGTKKDVFFIKNGCVSIVTNRMDNLVYHGEKGDFMNIQEIDFVYAGLEENFYSIGDFVKLIKGIYRGTRSRVKPINTK